jgi:hypothetical protein
MGGKAKPAVAIVVALLLATALAACGGSSGSAPATSSSTAKSEDSTSGSEGSASTQAEPSRQFLAPTGENEIPKFGKEADAAEREAVSKIVAESQQARAAGDWATQCATLAASVIKTLEKTASPLLSGHSCAKELEAEAANVPKYILANTMTGPIDALRVGPKSGYALYHGTKGVDWAVPITKEGGEWKVGALLPIKLS